MVLAMQMKLICYHVSISFFPIPSPPQALDNAGKLNDKCIAGSIGSHCSCVHKMLTCCNVSGTI